MSYIKVNQDKVNKEVAESLIKLCPFGAFEYQDGKLSINAGCKICKVCVKKDISGAVEFVEEKALAINKSLYQGIAVYIEQTNGKPHPVSFELIGKAKELAQKTKEEVYAIIIGNNVHHIALECLKYGVDKVFLYEDENYENFNVERYTNVIEAFYHKYHNNIILIGGTYQGRSFAPRIAARLKTGLTADCTKLDITENGDLLQIRPAFGGNIMASINTPNTRPQLATVRYKMFNMPCISEGKGEIIIEDTKNISKQTNINLLDIIPKTAAEDISDAEIIIAIGRAFKKEADLALIEPLVKNLNASVGCTRPLIENGWCDIKQQIGLSGRTVKPKLIINLGISGAVHFIEGMKDSELIISVNTDPNCKLFDISHYSFVGDIYEVLPKLNELIDTLIKGENNV